MDDLIYEDGFSYNNFLVLNGNQSHSNSTNTSFLSEKDESSSLDVLQVKYKKANSFVTIVDHEFFKDLYEVDEDAVRKTKELFNSL